MKRITPVLFIFAFIISACHSSENSNPNEVPTDTVNAGTEEIDTSELHNQIVNIPSLWKVETLKNKTVEKLVKPGNNALGQLSPQQLVSALNTSYPDIQLEFKAISNDTIYLSIPNSQKLTDESGDTGAYNYLATIVYNLTELNNIKYVNLSFKAGNHALPGTYSRDNFKRLR